MDTITLFYDYFLCNLRIKPSASQVLGKRATTEPQPQAHGSFIFTILRKIYTIFHSGCTNLHYPFSLHPLQHLLSFIFVIKSIIFFLL
uniref:Uncharacterized protein n=1 Tax=Urocitellus parryii TaxID=9999 RepID=A0A8D2KDZ7_UROPR